MKNQSHPIVIVKKRKHKGGGHGAHGSWKIAYADFMTAMMAFFLVMWLISISSPKELIQIAEYFRTPLATAVAVKIVSSLIKILLFASWRTFHTPAPPAMPSAIIRRRTNRNIFFMTIWFAHISGLKTGTARAKTSAVGHTHGRR